MTVPSSTGPSVVAPPNSTGIKVIVVGLGIGGLAAAIECHRKGHTVTAFDKIPVHTDTREHSLPVQSLSASGWYLTNIIDGDLLGISTNSARVIGKWGEGQIHETLNNVKNAAPSTEICDTAGKAIMPADMTGYKKEDGYWVLRSMLARTLFEHAQSLGVDLHVGPEAAVTDYWETDEESGVIVNGERYAADCVICCDGIGSKGKQIILHEDPPMKPTNEYAFRTSFATTELEKDPAAKWILEGMDENDRGRVYKGRGVEIGYSSFENGQMIVLVAICSVRTTSSPFASFFLSFSMFFLNG
jgi:2-polyprenyl-6-methoxyphenol hydroxylase-like FAD-dependent oxidoreductase